MQGVQGEREKLSGERGALMFFNLLRLAHVLAHDLIGVCFAAIVLVPTLLARRVDLNADDLNQTDPM